MRAETKLAIEIAKYIGYKYPKVIYHFDTGSGGRMSINEARINKALNPRRGYPDLFICEPKGIYNGLFIEIKAKSIMLKNGQMTKDKHIQEQRMYLHDLTQRKYHAVFGVGLDNIISIIDEYMNIK